MAATRTGPRAVRRVLATIATTGSTPPESDDVKVARATHSRRHRPPVLGPPAPRPAPVNALSEVERQHILAGFRSPEFCDLAPAQVWARLLDDGVSAIPPDVPTITNRQWDRDPTQAVSWVDLPDGRRSRAPVATGRSHVEWLGAPVP